MINELTGFLLEHWILSTGFVLSIVVAMVLERAHATRADKVIGNTELIDFLNNRGVVIDLRSKSDYDSGHIVGTKNIAADKLISDKVFINKNKNKDIILVCERGNYSLMIMKGLLGSGFKSVKCLDQRYIGWKKADMPVTKNKK